MIAKHLQEIVAAFLDVIDEFDGLDGFLRCSAGACDEESQHNLEFFLLINFCLNFLDKNSQQKLDFYLYLEVISAYLKSIEIFCDVIL